MNSNYLHRHLWCSYYLSPVRLSSHSFVSLVYTILPRDVGRHIMMQERNLYICGHRLRRNLHASSSRTQAKILNAISMRDHDMS